VAALVQGDRFKRLRIAVGRFGIFVPPDR
jgi:hypothetical protein